jgi:hypothetical protein
LEEGELMLVVLPSSNNNANEYENQKEGATLTQRKRKHDCAITCYVKSAEGNSGNSGKDELDNGDDVNEKQVKKQLRFLVPAPSIPSSSSALSSGSSVVRGSNSESRNEKKKRNLKSVYGTSDHDDGDDDDDDDDDDDIIYPLKEKAKAKIVPLAIISSSSSSSVTANSPLRADTYRQSSAGSEGINTGSEYDTSNRKKKTNQKVVVSAL